MSGEQAIFNLEIKKKSGLSLNPDIHHSKVFSSDEIKLIWCSKVFIIFPRNSLMSWDRKYSNLVLVVERYNLV